MRYVISGLLLLLGMMLFFMFITACAPARTMTRDTAGAEKGASVQSGESENADFSFDEEEPASAKSVSVVRGKKSSASAAPKLSSSAAKKSDGEIEDDEYEDSTSEHSERFYQKGEASWYGRAFHGKRTASGERFDMNELTAAHRKLPFGTILEVKNLNNDKRVKVRINDRGPYREGRILDLSYAAARKLDMLGSGKAMVGINIVRKGSGEDSSRKGLNDIEPAAGSDDGEEADDDITRDERVRTGRFALQAGAFYSKSNAQRLKSKIEGLTRRPVVVIRDGDMYKVRINSIASKKELEKVREALGDENITSFIVRDRE
jgi:rare lipoprotein A